MLKKVFLLSAGALMSAADCLAQAPDGGSDHWQNGGPVSIFWGTKSRKSYVNPCRGATIRKCAELVPQNNVAPLSMTGTASTATMVLRIKRLRENEGIGTGGSRAEGHTRLD